MTGGPGSDLSGRCEGRPEGAHGCACLPAFPRPHNCPPASRAPSPARPLVQRRRLPSRGACSDRRPPSATARCGRRRDAPGPTPDSGRDPTRTRCQAPTKEGRELRARRRRAGRCCGLRAQRADLHDVDGQLADLLLGVRLLKDLRGRLVLRGGHSGGKTELLFREADAARGHEHSGP